MWRTRDSPKDETGLVTAQNVFSSRGIVARVANEQTLYHIKDAHGDVIGLWDEFNRPLDSISYDPYGNQLSTELSVWDGNMLQVLQRKEEGVSSPFGYCGEYTDAETGFVYLRARYYDSQAGRFISEDPIRSGLNWYAYAANNPVRYIDPSGLVEVGLRAYAGTYEGATVTWDDKTKTATVTYDGKELKVKSTKSNNRKGKIYVDDSLFINAFGTGSDKLVVYREGNNVSIRANFDISGKAAGNTIPGSTDTYTSAFLKGIEDIWSGTFGKYEVSTYTGESSKGINVKINNKSGISNVSWGLFGWSKTRPGKATMYTGDSRSSGSYSVDDFMWVSAHEFGHLLGVNDAYNSKNSQGVTSIFNVFGTGVQEGDMDMVLKAWRLGKSQKWA